MTDDRSLHDRLAAVADAVPVRPPSPVAGLTRSPVTLGPALRAPMSRSWLPVALMAVLVVVAVGILASGSQPAYGPVVETVRQGDFELTLRADKGRYAPGEPIEIEASLTYRGPDAEAQTVHAGGAASSPINFVIREPVFGATLGGFWEASRKRTVLARDVPLVVPFAKLGGWLNPPPDAFQTWLSEPGLELPSGVWHVAAIAEFSVADVGQFKLEAEIAISVESSSPTELIQPSPSEHANPPQSSTVRDGDFELTIRSGKSRYTTGEAVDVSASLVYRGPEAAVDVSGGLGQIWSRERSGEIVVGFEGPLIMICPGGTYLQGVPHEVSIVTVRQTADGFEPQPVPRLPAGTWHLYAVAGTCGGSEPDAIAFALEAEITIEVTDDSALPPTPTPESSSVPLRPLPLVQITLWKAPEPQKGCYLQYHEGILARHPESGLGIIEDGTLKAVRWPYWARAIDEDGTVVLLGPKDEAFAREGDVVSMSGPGGPGPRDAIYACDGVGVVVPVEPS